MRTAGEGCGYLLNPFVAGNGDRDAAAELTRHYQEIWNPVCGIAR